MYNDEEAGSLKDTLIAAMSAVADHNAERAADTIAEIVGMGPGHVHAALFAWSAPVLKISGGEGPGSWKISALDTVTGERVELDDCDMKPWDKDALRLVVCAGNIDHAGIAEIVNGYYDQDPESLAKLLLSMLELSASAAKRLT